MQQRVDVERLTANNPGPMTLEGTNTYLIGRDPAVVIDPGPDEDEHIEAIRRAGEERGGIGTVLLTHDDADHLAGVEPLGIQPARPVDGDVVAGLTAIATPGHAAEHLCFLLPDDDNRFACFCGDLILGEGSTIVGPRRLGGSLADYMRSLERLRSYELTVLYPGHGPEIRDPSAKIDEYIAHRQERERRLVAALDDGLRTADELLDRAWSDAPAALRAAATVTLAAHLDKLDEEGRLPDGVERPQLSLLGEP
jgi:glyoxylase-like metal-dependent hydrolase (beta-lactamase superfamily II)